LGTEVDEVTTMDDQMQIRVAVSEVFTNERTSLERQWGEGDEISTEDLRVALRRYRSFFERLLTL